MHGTWNRLVHKQLLANRHQLYSAWCGSSWPSALQQDFANGFLFGKLLYHYNLQPDLASFIDKGKPDAVIKNYVRLQVG